MASILLPGPAKSRLGFADRDASRARTALAPLRRLACDRRDAVVGRALACADRERLKPMSARQRGLRRVASARGRLEPDKSIEQRLLGFEDFCSRDRQREPADAIDFRKCRTTSAARRPFDLERVARKQRDVEIAFERECLDVLAGSLPDGGTAKTLVIAYEPVWAIGTGLTPTVKDVEQVHGFIRETLKKRFGEEGAGMRILYGGSVKPSNATELLAVTNVNGALIGGASLKAADFLAIASAVS